MSLPLFVWALTGIGYLAGAHPSDGGWPAVLPYIGGLTVVWWLVCSATPNLVVVGPDRLAKRTLGRWSVIHAGDVASVVPSRTGFQSYLVIKATTGSKVVVGRAMVRGAERRQALLAFLALTPAGGGASSDLPSSGSGPRTTTRTRVWRGVVAGAIVLNGVVGALRLAGALTPSPRLHQQPVAAASPSPSAAPAVTAPALRMPHLAAGGWHLLGPPVVLPLDEVVSDPTAISAWKHVGFHGDESFIISKGNMVSGSGSGQDASVTVARFRSTSGARRALASQRAAAGILGQEVALPRFPASLDYAVVMASSPPQVEAWAQSGNVVVQVSVLPDSGRVIPAAVQAREEGTLVSEVLADTGGTR